MKIKFTKIEWEYLNPISLYTDLIPEEGSEIDGLIEIEMSIGDWEEASGFIAAESNHAEEQDVQAQLDSIHDKIEKSMVQRN